MSEPTTAEGRALLEDLAGIYECRDDIARIEAAAAETERARIRATDIEVMASALYETDPPESWMRTGTDEYRKRAAAMVDIIARDRRAVLAAIDATGTAPADPSPTPDRADPCDHSWETDSNICPECGADWTEYLRRGGGPRPLATPDRADPTMHTTVVETATPDRAAIDGEAKG